MVNIGSLEAKVKVQSEGLDQLKKLKEFSQGVTDSMEGLNSATDEFNNVGKQFSKVTDTAERRQRRFRGELLGTMFIGMQVNAFFDQYIQAAKDMNGENELLAASIGAAVLEFRELAGLTDLVDFFADFADQHPILVGGFVQLAAWGAKVLEVLSQIGLLVGFGPLILKGLKDTINLFKTWFTRAGLVLGVVKGIFKTLAGFLGVIDIVKGLVLIFSQASGVINVVKGTLLVIAGIAAIIFAAFGGWIPLVISIGAGILAWATKFQPFKNAIMTVWNVLKSISNLLSQAFIKASKFGGFGGFFKGFSLTPFAEGGIVTRPTAALIGERGPEAVIPLRQLQTFAPNVTVNASVGNNVDISALASRLASVYSSQLDQLGLRRRVG